MTFYQTECSSISSTTAFRYEEWVEQRIRPYFIPKILQTMPFSWGRGRRKFSPIPTLIGLWGLPYHPPTAVGSTSGWEFGSDLKWHHEELDTPPEVSLPGDSSRDLLIPTRWRSPTTFERVTWTHHPKKGTKNCQVGIIWYPCFFLGGCKMGQEN